MVSYLPISLQWGLCPNPRQGILLTKARLTFIDSWSTHRRLTLAVLALWVHQHSWNAGCLSECNVLSYADARQIETTTTTNKQTNKNNNNNNNQQQPTTTTTTTTNQQQQQQQPTATTNNNNQQQQQHQQPTTTTTTTTTTNNNHNNNNKQQPTNNNQQTTTTTTNNQRPTTNNQQPQQQQQQQQPQPQPQQQQQQQQPQQQQQEAHYSSTETRTLMPCTATLFASPILDYMNLDPWPSILDPRLDSRDFWIPDLRFSILGSGDFGSSILNPSHMILDPRPS